jgi:Questin oxidase-like
MNGDAGALHGLLDQAQSFDAEYGDGLSNHLPMALVALARLGASEARLAEFSARYAQRRRLRPARAAQAWPAGDAWPSRFGQRAAWPAYRDLFAQWLAHEGAGDVLAQVLPALMPGCAAAAFHGLIRTAYGLQASHAGEVADGLAHWAAWHQPLGALPDLPARTADPVDLLRTLRAGRSKARLIAGRMADAARDGHVNRAVAPLAIDEHTPRRLAQAAAFAYAESGNFTALHLLTASHAMWVVAPLADDGHAAWRAFWQAYAHGVVAAGLRPRAAAPLLGWDEIVARAIASDDEHVVKLVDSARELPRLLDAADDTAWRRAASRAVAAAG